jgi:hypothetical protein
VRSQNGLILKVKVVLGSQGRQGFFPTRLVLFDSAAALTGQHIAIERSDYVLILASTPSL